MCVCKCGEGAKWTVLELLASRQRLVDHLSLRLTAKLHCVAEVITPNLIALPATFTTRDSPQHLACIFRFFFVLAWPFSSRLEPRYGNDKRAQRHRSGPFWSGVGLLRTLALGHVRNGEKGTARNVL